MLRAIAALLVVLFHLGGALAAPKYFDTPVFDRVFLSGGAAGVYFFFVLSGFIITTVHWQDIGDRSRLARYVLKRCIRIYPAYWVVFALAYVGLAFINSEALPKDLPSLVAALGLLPQASAPVVVVAWSLHYEILFYAFFALLIASPRLAALTAGGAVGWIALRGMDASVPLSFLSTGLFGLFAIGLLVALAVRAQRYVIAGPYAAVLGAVGFVALAIGASITETRDLGGPTWVLAFGLSSALLLFGLATMERQGVTMRWPTAVALGDASYALYLVHYPLISVVCKVAVLGGLTGVAGAVLTALVAVPLCIAVAIGLNRFFERPLIRIARQVWPSTSAKVALQP